MESLKDIRGGKVPPRICFAELPQFNEDSFHCCGRDGAARLRCFQRHSTFFFLTQFFALASINALDSISAFARAIRRVSSPFHRLSMTSFKISNKVFPVGILPSDSNFGNQAGMNWFRYHCLNYLYLRHKNSPSMAFTRIARAFFLGLFGGKVLNLNTFPEIPGVAFPA